MGAHSNDTPVLDTGGRLSVYSRDLGGLRGSFIALGPLVVGATGGPFFSRAVVPPLWLPGWLTAFRVRDGGKARPGAELETVTERLADDHCTGDTMEAGGPINLVEERRGDLDGELPCPSRWYLLHVRPPFTGWRPVEARAHARHNKPPVAPDSRRHESITGDVSPHPRQ